MSKIDLHKDRKRILRYMKSRIRDYPVYENFGPGSDLDDISAIVAGFEIEQSGWHCVVFDTRPDSYNDGEWTLWAPDLKEEYKHWAIEDYSVPISVKSYDPWSDIFENSYLDEWVLGNFIGTMILDVLEEQLPSVFKKLPCAEKVEVYVEEFNGFFGWQETYYPGIKNE